jgi:hypothetical protein
MSLNVQLLNEQMSPCTLKTSRLMEKVNQPKLNHRINNSEINKTELGGVHDRRELNSMNKDG